MRPRLAAAVALASGAVALLGAALPPAPAQPIKFNHKIHAGDNRIGCTSCHAYAEHGPVAGIPSMARCQGCHKFVKNDPDHPAIDKELKALQPILQDGKPIDWVRVYRVPDHVYFTHERHLASKAKLKCQDCHGPVETMEVMRQVSPLTMGWCLDCHERKKAPRDCWTCHK